jgi:cell division protease FtsH
MVKEYGMSSKVGQVYFAREKRPLYLDIGFPGEAEYSEATSELIDHEIKEIIDEQYTRALEILRKKQKILEKGADLLLEKEKIEGSALKALMNQSSNAAE